MAAELEQDLGIKPEFIKGGGGIFDVIADGTVVFTRRGVGGVAGVGRFPEAGEVVAKLKSA